MNQWGKNLGCLLLSVTAKETLDLWKNKRYLPKFLQRWNKHPYTYLEMKHQFFCVSSGYKNGDSNPIYPEALTYEKNNVIFP